MLFSLLLISTPMFITDYKSLDYLKTVGDIYYNNLKKIDIDPALYSVVFIDIDNTAKNIEKKISKINNFNRYSLSVHIDLRAAANAAGFKTVIFNYNNIPEIKEKIQDSKKEWRQNDFYRYCVTGDLLLVKVA